MYDKYVCMHTRVTCTQVRSLTCARWRSRARSSARARSRLVRVHDHTVTVTVQSTFPFGCLIRVRSRQNSFSSVIVRPRPSSPFSFVLLQSSSVHLRPSSVSSGHGIGQGHNKRLHRHSSFLARSGRRCMMTFPKVRASNPAICSRRECARASLHTQQ